MRDTIRYYARRLWFGRQVIMQDPEWADNAEIPQRPSHLMLHVRFQRKWNGRRPNVEARYYETEEAENGTGQT